MANKDTGDILKNANASLDMYSDLITFVNTVQSQVMVVLDCYQALNRQYSMATDSEPGTLVKAKTDLLFQESDSIKNGLDASLNDLSNLIIQVETKVDQTNLQISQLKKEDNA